MVVFCNAKQGGSYFATAYSFNGSFLLCHYLYPGSLWIPQLNHHDLIPGHETNDKAQDKYSYAEGMAAGNVQLPIFNEKYTVERLLRAVTRLDYPANRLQIQVLDDSTDDTFDLVARLVEEYKSHGVNIELIHRVDRKGYKAGALNHGLRTTTGELIAIFD